MDGFVFFVGGGSGVQTIYMHICPMSMLQFYDTLIGLAAQTYLYGEAVHWQFNYS